MAGKKTKQIEATAVLASAVTRQKTSLLRCLGPGPCLSNKVPQETKNNNLHRLDVLVQYIVNLPKWKVHDVMVMVLSDSISLKSQIQQVTKTLGFASLKRSSHAKWGAHHEAPVKTCIKASLAMWIVYKPIGLACLDGSWSPKAAPIPIFFRISTPCTAGRSFEQSTWALMKTHFSSRLQWTGTYQLRSSGELTQIVACQSLAGYLPHFCHLQRPQLSKLGTMEDDSDDPLRSLTSKYCILYPPFICQETEAKMFAQFRDEAYSHAGAACLDLKIGF